MQIRPDWEKAAVYGLTAQNIGETIQTAIEGAVPTQLQRGNRLVDVRVQFDRTSVKSIAQLGQIPLSGGNNSIVRLSDVANITIGKAPGEIQRLNQRQVFLVVGNLNKGASLGDAVQQVDAVLSEMKLPPGVSIVPSSAAETNQQLQTSLKLLGGLATFLVFVAMAVQYNSLVDPLVILLTVPLALAAGVFGLYVTKTAIGATVMIGAILLVGIVVNNGIIMLELANQILEEENVDRTTAILRAGTSALAADFDDNYYYSFGFVSPSFGNWRGFGVSATFGCGGVFRFVAGDADDAVYYSLFLYFAARLLWDVCSEEEAAGGCYSRAEDGEKDSEFVKC